MTVPIAALQWYRLQCYAWYRFSAIVKVAQGTYANLAIITHSSSEFIVDFVRVMPGLPKAGVQSRIVLTPEHAKRLMYALQENVAKYERNFGPIRMPEEMNGGNNGPDGKTFIPPISGFKGEA